LSHDVYQRISFVQRGFTMRNNKMSTPVHTYPVITPEQVELLMHAARVERAQALRSMLQRLFRRQREAKAWPAPQQALGANSGC
jgi:hypothetical protein